MYISLTYQLNVTHITGQLLAINLSFRFIIQYIDKHITPLFWDAVDLDNLNSTPIFIFSKSMYITWHIIKKKILSTVKNNIYNG